MQSHHKFLALLNVAAISTVVGMASLRSQTQGDLPAKEQKIHGIDESHWPTAEYEAPEPTDEKERVKRKAKAQRFDKSLFGVKGAINAPPNTGHMITLTDDWEVEMPALPALQSDVVVIGDVMGARAHVSNDKTGVYSEFPLHVKEVLKADGLSTLKRDNVIMIERRGGMVRGPSGRVHLFRVGGQSMPGAGRCYVMFLRRAGGEEDYLIITGYELRAGRVSPLDGGVEKFKVYEGWSEDAFLQAVRKAIAGA